MKIHTTLLPHTPWPLHTSAQQWASLIEDTLRGPFLSETPHGGFKRWKPQLDIADTGQELHVTLDAPGMSPENFELTLEDNTLQISGTRTLPNPTPSENSSGTHSLRCERPSGAFQRTIPLPYPVETQKIEATYKEGILNVRLPKTAEAQAKKIAIKT